MTKAQAQSELKIWDPLRLEARKIEPGRSSPSENSSARSVSPMTRNATSNLKFCPKEIDTNNDFPLLEIFVANVGFFFDVIGSKKFRIENSDVAEKVRYQTETAK